MITGCVDAFLSYFFFFCSAFGWVLIRFILDLMACRGAHCISGQLIINFQSGHICLSHRHLLVTLSSRFTLFLNNYMSNFVIKMFLLLLFEIAEIFVLFGDSTSKDMTLFKIGSQHFSFFTIKRAL